MDQPSGPSVNSFVVCQFSICYNFHRVTERTDRSAMPAPAPWRLRGRRRRGQLPHRRRRRGAPSARAAAAAAVRDPTHTVYPASSASSPRRRDGERGR